MLCKMSVLDPVIARLLPEIIALRHDLHRHPELSLHEERTARLVSARLAQEGIPHETHIAGMHGIVATITGGKGRGKTLALRGDMDALPIQEEADPPYKSENPGVMHACGHDGHTANLLGTALALNAIKDELCGTVKLFFQPAEEGTSGAKPMCQAGVMDGVDRVIMIHGWPDLPVGSVGLRVGATMASSDSFALTIGGVGGHAAYPHQTVDPVYVGAQVVTALQSLVAREISPLAPAVVSVTTFHAGTTRNVIPATAELSGTVRTLDDSLRATMRERLERVIGGICAAHRATFEFQWRDGTPVVVNDAEVVGDIHAAAVATLGAENVVMLDEATMGAEDFAWYLEHAPGAMIRLGTGCAYKLHHPKYDYGDGALEPGIRLFTEIARRYLSTMLFDHPREG
jgi:amidohydrolase